MWWDPPEALVGTRRDTDVLVSRDTEGGALQGTLGPRGARIDRLEATRRVLGPCLRLRVGGRGVLLAPQGTVTARPLCHSSPSTASSSGPCS